MDHEYTAVEQPALEQLKALGYAYVPGAAMVPASGERGSFREVVLEGRFRSALMRINPWLSADNLNKVVRDLTVIQAASLLEATVQQQRALGDRQGLAATLQTLLTIYLAQADRALEAGDDDAAARLAATIRQMDEEWRALLAHQACHADGKREA